jgi:hypothetical protein
MRDLFCAEPELCRWDFLGGSLALLAADFDQPKKRRTSRVVAPPVLRLASTGSCHRLVKSPRRSQRRSSTGTNASGSSDIFSGAARELLRRPTMTPASTMNAKVVTT